MTLYMYDSTDVTQIPRTCQMAAGYLDGALIPSTLPALRKWVPLARIVDICVHAGQLGAVADYEKGDFLLSQLPAWATLARAAHIDPIVYCSTSAWPAVVTLFQQQRVALPWWWEAHYDGIPVLNRDPRAVAKQYANAKFTGRNLDISIVGPNWPGLNPPAPPSTEWSLTVQTLDLRKAGATPVKGKSVKALQQLLEIAVPSLKTDGAAGQLTLNALLHYQQANGLLPDGVAGPSTWAALAAQ